jgi:hypothetical protein
LRSSQKRMEQKRRIRRTQATHNAYAPADVRAVAVTHLLTVEFSSGLRVKKKRDPFVWSQVQI